MYDGQHETSKDVSEIEERIISPINKTVIEGLPELPKGGIEEVHFSYPNEEILRGQNEIRSRNCISINYKRVSNSKQCFYVGNNF